MRQILLYTLSNFFDSINLIKLIWPRISGFRFSLIKTVNQSYTERKQIFLFEKVHLNWIRIEAVAQSRCFLQKRCS